MAVLFQAKEDDWQLVGAGVFGVIRERELIMDNQSLQALVARIAGTADVALIVPALERFEVQSEIRLTEALAIQATQRAVDFITSEETLLSTQAASLSARRQRLADHLQRR